MINLLPPADSKTFIAGRVNTILVRYIWLTAGLFGLLTAISGLTYFMLDTTRANAEKQISENTSNASSYQSVQARTQEFQTNLSIAKSILDRRTYYSAALLKLSKYLPAGVVIDKISLDSSTYGTPVSLHFLAASEDTAISLKKALQDSNMFSDVHFQSLNLQENGKGADGKVYRVGINMSTTINEKGISDETN